MLGGAVFANGTGTPPLPAEWGAGVDRTNWFWSSHYVKTPAFQWKMIVARATAQRPVNVLAFWMPNSELALAAKVNEYIVSVAQLEANLARWGVPELFNIPGGWDKNTLPAAVWEDPAGCNRG